MRPRKFLPNQYGGGAHVRPRFRPARSLFDTHYEQDGLAKAVLGGFSTDGYPMANDDPAAPPTVPLPSLARWLLALALGIAETLTANMAQGWSDGPVGAVVAA